MTDSFDRADQDADVLPFTPVPLARNRHDGWTEPRQRAFVAGLVRTGSVAEAARAIGMSAQSAYRLRQRPGAESFAGAWSDALDLASDRALGAAVMRLVHGITVARFYRGRFVGTFHRHDAAAVLRALSAGGRQR